MIYSIKLAHVCAQQGERFGHLDVSSLAEEENPLVSGKTVQAHFLFCFFDPGYLKQKQGNGS